MSNLQLALVAVTTVFCIGGVIVDLLPAADSEAFDYMRIKPGILHLAGDA